MSVEFDEQVVVAEPYNGNADGSEAKGMMGWLVKKGIARNVKMANMLLIAISIIFFALSFLSFIVM